MNILNTATIIFLAGSGLAAQAPSQSFAQRLEVLQPEVERLKNSTEYKRAIDIIEAVLPASVPAFEKNPGDPGVALNSFIERNAVQSLYVLLGQAQAMAGYYEGAISSLRKAEEIAVLNATEVEGAVNPLIQSWNVVLEGSKAQLEAMPAEKEKIKHLEERKKEIEAMRRTSRADRAELEDITSYLEEVLPILESNITLWETNLQRAPAIINQLNEMARTSKEDATRFTPAIQAIQDDIDSENETIRSSFDGNKARYVESVLDTEGNLADLQTQADKLKLLYRLQVLDPQNRTVQQHIDAIKGQS